MDENYIDGALTQICLKPGQSCNGKDLIYFYKPRLIEIIQELINDQKASDKPVS